MSHKKLYRSKENRFFLGVCGGLGEYFDVDPTIIRLMWVFVSVFNFMLGGIIVYIFAGVMIPSKEMGE